MSGELTEAKLWTRAFILDTASNFLIYNVYYGLMAIIATYTMDVLHATPSDAGLVTGMFVVGGLAARIPTGRLIGRLGEKTTLYAGLALYLFTSFLYFIVGGMPGLLATRFLHGLGFGISATATGTIAARIIPEKRCGEGISYYALSTTLAAAVGPSAGMYLYQHGSFNVVLILCTTLVALCCVASFFIRASRPQVSETAVPEREAMKKQPSLLHDYIEVKALPVSVLSGLMVFGYAGIMVFLSSFAKETGLQSAGNVYFIIYSVVVLFSRPFIGRLFDRRGENFVIYPSIVSFALSLLLLTFAQSGTMLLASAVFVSFGYGTFFACGNAVALKVSPRDRIHLATSTYFAMADLGMGIAPFLLGFLVPAVGFRGLYFCLSGLLFCCIPLYYFVHGAGAARSKAVVAAGAAD